MGEPILGRLPGEDDETYRQRIVTAAQTRWQNNAFVQVDDNAHLSDLEDGSGVWIQAWVWLDFEQEDDNG